MNVENYMTFSGQSISNPYVAFLDNASTYTILTNPKFFKGHIVHLDICFLEPLIVSPYLQAMHYGKKSLS